jgi:hypothetical protein
MSANIVDFYLSAYGPTIRIDAQEVAAIEVLVRAFDRLASQAAESVDLRLIQEFAFTKDVEGLVFTLVEKPVRKKVVRTSRKDEVPTFEMRGTVDDWMDARDLTSPLLCGSACHQYLSPDYPDDAILEVAINEPLPAWIEARADG